MFWSKEIENWVDMVDYARRNLGESGGMLPQEILDFRII